MSRIGRMPISVPAGVEVKNENNLITVKGSKGTVSRQFSKELGIEVKDGVITVTRPSESKEHKSLHGLTRTLISNMVTGVTKGFERKLIINGVGYKASKQGNKLVLNLGYSHDCEVLEEDGITIECPSQLEVVIKGIDKQKVGQFASKIRDLRKVEPYHAYGVRYDDEVVIKKVGKTAGKGAKK